MTANGIGKLLLYFAFDIDKEIRRCGARFQRIFVIDLPVIANERHVAVIVLAPFVLEEVEDIDPVVARAGSATVHEDRVKVIFDFPQVCKLGADLRF